MAEKDKKQKAPKSANHQRHHSAFVSGIIKENPLFIAILGCCPALAVTTSFENAFGMGLLFTFVLVCSNVLVSLLRKLIPDEVRTPCYIVIIAAFVTITKMMTQAFIPELYKSLGVFLSLLVVNCIVLGRAEAFASKNTVLDSFLDGIGNGIGFTLAICLMGIVREILGTGMLTFGKVFTFIPLTQLPILKDPNGAWDYSMSLFANPAGGFIIFGIILSIIMAIRGHKANIEKVEKRKARKAAMEAKKKAQAAAAAKAQVAAKAVKPQPTVNKEAGK